MRRKAQDFVDHVRSVHVEIAVVPKEIRRRRLGDEGKQHISNKRQKKIVAERLKR